MQYQIWVPSRFTIVYRSFSKCEQSSQYITIHCNWILIWAKLLQKEATEVTLWIPWLARRQILPPNVPKAHVASLLTGPNFLQMVVAGELYVKSYGDLLVLLLAATCSKYFLFWCLDASRCDMQSILSLLRSTSGFEEFTNVCKIVRFMTLAQAASTFQPISKTKQFKLTINQRNMVIVICATISIYIK